MVALLATRRAESFALPKVGIMMATSRAMIDTTTSSSTRVKPPETDCLAFLFIISLLFPCGENQVVIGKEFAVHAGPNQDEAAGVARSQAQIRPRPRGQTRIGDIGLKVLLLRGGRVVRIKPIEGPRLILFLVGGGPLGPVLLNRRTGAPQRVSGHEGVECRRGVVVEPVHAKGVIRGGGKRIPHSGNARPTGEI